MDPLPDAWKKPDYSYKEALRIVAWWRYGGPHPAHDADPSRKVQGYAAADLRPIVQSEERELHNNHNNHNKKMSDQFYRYCGDGEISDRYEVLSRELILGKSGIEIKERRSPSVTYIRVTWVLYDALLALCPGIFTEATTDRPLKSADEKRGKRIQEIAAGLGIDVLSPGYGEKKTIKTACLEYHAEFTAETFEHAWKTRATWAKRLADIRRHSP